MTLYVPMQQNARMPGYSVWNGTRRRRIQIPIMGRLRTSSIMLPIHMLATTPQNRSGYLVRTCGPGDMPWICRAPSMSAMAAPAGIPSVNIGMKCVRAAALFAASGPATPSIAPCPKRLGSFASWRSIAYEANELRSGPVPGKIPRNPPSAVPRSTGFHDSFRSFRVGNRPVTLAMASAHCTGKPTFMMTSVNANRPTATATKLTASVNAGMPNV